MDKKIKTIMKDVKKGEIKINNGMFFLPDDFKKMFKSKSKSKWGALREEGIVGEAGVRWEREKS